MHQKPTQLPHRIFLSWPTIFFASVYDNRNFARVTMHMVTMLNPTPVNCLFLAAGDLLVLDSENYFLSPDSPIAAPAAWSCFTSSPIVASSAILIRRGFVLSVVWMLMSICFMLRCCLGVCWFINHVFQIHEVAERRTAPKQHVHLGSLYKTC